MYRLYRFYDAQGTLLYIGQTGRMPWQRLLEHVCRQPWADRMASWQVDPRWYPTLDAVLAAERSAIRTERPVYNWKHNEGNPRRQWAGPPRQAPAGGAVRTARAARATRAARPRSRPRRRRFVIRRPRLTVSRLIGRLLTIGVVALFGYGFWQFVVAP